MSAISGTPSNGRLLSPFWMFSTIFSSLSVQNNITEKACTPHMIARFMTP
jgi:hypothetical protein